MAKVIGIVGSRRRDSMEDLEITAEAANNIYEKGDSFVSGGCPKGGDRFCELIAASLQAPIVIHPANWKQFGRSAGFERNTYIARDADVLIACVAPDRKGGTEDTIRKFKRFHPKGVLILV